MSDVAHAILSHLALVGAERQRRAAKPELQSCVNALKAYQQRRFTHTYADLLSTPRYGPAARFFLNELYGPTDFSQRDTQFARVVPAMVRLFPRELVATVATLASLHALSEALDTRMAEQMTSPTLDGRTYISIWQANGERGERERQITLTVDVGEALDRLTRKSLLRHSLRMMRVPAAAAGMGALQQFLESGFDTFHAMRGAQEFLQTVRTREHELAAVLFAAELPGTAVAATDLPAASLQQALKLLP